MKTSTIDRQIEQAAISKISELNFYHEGLTTLPNRIGELSALTKLYLSYNRLVSLPDSTGDLANLTDLHLSYNRLINLPDRITELTNLRRLYLHNNQLTQLPKEIGRLTNLTDLHLDNNQLTSLPVSICELTHLIRLNLNGNLLTDLSMLQDLSKLETVRFARMNLPRQYWTKFSDWQPQWLLTEGNTEIRRILIEQVGYEKICEDLHAVSIDIWREYTLLKIDMPKPDGFFPFRTFTDFNAPEPIILLKMTCPSTAHVHILRVPPEMAGAEAAITWVNHGIHPDRIAVQT
jgi:leucine-rich repeat protein SHOC2